MRWQSYAIAGATVVAVVGAGCARGRGPARPVAEVNRTSAASASAITPSAPERGSVLSDPSCPGGEAVLVFEAGVEQGRICKSDAAAKGLTVIDLSDDWTPAVLAPAPDGRVSSYHAHYISLANEQLRPDAEPEDALGELYGVVPAFSVVRTRLADAKRHACWAELDPEPIGGLPKHQWSMDDKLRVKASLSRWRRLNAELERARVKKGLPDIESLATVRGYAKKVEKWRPLDRLHRGIVAVQDRLDCEGFLIREKIDGEFTWRTGNAVELFQRRNFLMPNERLDGETRAALMLDSKELDFRLALRILRERVVDATGLIEDGSAGEGPGPVLGRMLDPENMRAARGHVPMDGAAPDLIHPATEAAAKALGWTDADAVRAFLEAHRGGFEVAVALPPAPAYHAAHMELAAELDRGDVWYDEVPKRRKVKRRPTLVVYSIEGEVRRPLVRWPSTIGSWADVRLPSGAVKQKWKESDVGPRVWRDVYAAPTWTPPPTTPDRDLVRNLWNGRYRLKSEAFGPGAHSAYGMVMMIHHKEKKKGNTVTYGDNGIRTHGSSTVTSIVNGTSHGCHRLYNQLAVRLGGFLLRHRDHVIKGEQKISYRRRVRFKGDYEARIDSKGFLYELTPPVPVDVLKGTILSKRKSPPTNSAPARP